MAGHYPKPEHGRIIETFAGSARYALLHFENDVTLVDADPKIIEVWKFLQQATPQDILNFPNFKLGDDLKDFNFSYAEYEFLRLMLQPGTVGGSKACAWGARDFERNKKNIAAQLFKIRHWEFINADYLTLHNEKATWFVDPPYQVGGHKYKFGNRGFDYETLALWCDTRMGLTIVCENSGATWGSFSPLKALQGIRKKTTEVVWIMRA